METLSILISTGNTRDMMKFIDLLPYILDRVQQEHLRHEVDTFESGAAMIDIWIEDKLYLIQIDNDSIGLSLITEETLLFDIIPDQVFKDASSFKRCFEMIFQASAK